MIINIDYLQYAGTSPMLQRLVEEDIAQNSKSAFENWQTTEILIILIQQLEKNKCQIFNIWKNCP